jgi:two-component system chemotaxis response regulator CheB
MTEERARRAQLATGRDVVVIGASAGGHGPLKELLAHVPAGLPVTFLVVFHRLRPSLPGQRDVLPDLLRSTSKLAVVEALDRSEYRRGYVHVAPLALA